MSFKLKIMLAVCAAGILSVLVATIVSVRSISNEGEFGLLEKSRAILNRIQITSEYIAQQGGLNRTVEYMQAKYPDGNLPKEAKLDVLKQVPVFAAMQVGMTDAKSDAYSFRVFSNEPRRKENMATAAEMEIFNRFERDPNLKEWTETTEDDVRVFRPVRLSESQGCLVCHGNPQNSPWKNGKDILGHDMENWVDGRLHGVFAITTSKAQIKANSQAATTVLVLCSLATTFLVLVLAYFFVTKAVQAIAQIVEELRGAGENVALASDEISQSSQALSDSATNAAASIEETSASSEEVRAMISANAKSAEQAKDLSAECQSGAVSGSTKVNSLIEAMQEIQKSSGQIEEIVSVIDDIAFQTNLLALNAAVEAARAGEQGKGFAVVAEAVRSLAQRSATSAKEISTLISSSVEKIGQGSEIAQQSGEALQAIVESVEKVRTLNVEIASASSEQTKGVDSINASINTLDRVTQLNAAAAEEAAAASEKLSEQSHQLHSLVDSLWSVMEGRKTQKTHPGTPRAKSAPIKQAGFPHTVKKASSQDAA